MSSGPKSEEHFEKALELDNLNEAQYCFEKVLEMTPDNNLVKNDRWVNWKRRKWL